MQCLTVVIAADSLVESSKFRGCQLTHVAVTNVCNLNPVLVTQHPARQMVRKMRTICIAMARRIASHCFVGPLSFSNMYAYCIDVVPGVLAPEAGPDVEAEAEADADGDVRSAAGAVPAAPALPSAVVVAVTMAIQRDNMRR